ncbi:MAG: hypothetical protein F4Z04_05840 [Acidobacteria bacterium]|nr:hypothetical protein [Acidobacteriota bacterium]MXZ71013.1 hypothetical protein [Acidobacteriota bacterium]
MRPSVAILLASALCCAATPAGAQSDAVQVSRSGRGAYEASLAPHPRGFAIAWHDTRHGLPEIHARLVDRSGRPFPDEYRLTTGAGRSYEPSLAVSRPSVSDDLVVGWYEVAADDSTSFAKVGAWTADGAPLWERTLSDPRRHGRATVVAAAGDRIQCVWIEQAREPRSDGSRKPATGNPPTHAEREPSAAIWAQQLGPDGEPVGAARRIADASRTTWNLNLRVDAEGVPWVAFDAQLGTRASELFVARLGRDWVTLHRLSADDGASSVYPDLAFGAGRAAVTWWDTRDGNAEVYLAVVDEEELPHGIEPVAARVSDTAGESLGAYIAWNGARFGLAWSDESEPGRPHEVYFQQFTAAGIPVRAPRRLTDNPTASLIPAIRAAGSRFALAWNEDNVNARGEHRSGGRSEVLFALVP